MKLLHVVGARPNFPELTPVHRRPGEITRLLRDLDRPPKQRRPEGWDGQAAARVVDALKTCG